MKYARKAGKRKETKATNIRNRVSIHERPVEVDGKRFGDWEMDLIVDKDNHAILTMIERSTNFLLMSKLKHGKKAMYTFKIKVQFPLPLPRLRRVAEKARERHMKIALLS